MTGGIRHRGSAPSATSPGWCSGFSSACPAPSWIPGRGEPDRAAPARLLPDLLSLNDAQAGLGTGTRGWPGLLTRTLTTGGDGYCLHSTLQASPAARDLLPVLRRIGDHCGAAIGAGEDFVHYDFTPANLLSDGPRSPA